MMEIYIAERLSDKEEKVHELINLVIAPRLTFSQKKEVFDFLLEKYHNDFKKEHQAVLSTMTGLIAQRNIFAHWPAEFSQYAVDVYDSRTSITLIRLKNWRDDNSKELHLGERVEYNQSKTNEWIMRFLDLNAVLKKLIMDTAPPLK
jgi:hypothetical protein